jgi:hypothetical protein
MNEYRHELVVEALQERIHQLELEILRLQEENQKIRVELDSEPF